MSGGVVWDCTALAPTDPGTLQPAAPRLPGWPECQVAFAAVRSVALAPLAGAPHADADADAGDDGSGGPAVGAPASKESGWTR